MASSRRNLAGQKCAQSKGMWFSKTLKTISPEHEPQRCTERAAQAVSFCFQSFSQAKLTVCSLQHYTKTTRLHVRILSREVGHWQRKKSLKWESGSHSKKKPNYKLRHAPQHRMYSPSIPPALFGPTTSENVLYCSAITTRMLQSPARWH